AAFAAHALGHENSHDARRPNHACGMELDELHIDEFGARVISEGMAIAGIFPTVAGDLESATDAAHGEDDGARAKNFKTTTFAIVSEHAANTIAIFEKLDRGVFHENFDAFVHAVVLERANHFQAGAVADVSEARI